jgi:tetratricopeptide (TPR) repeat protein
MLFDLRGAGRRRTVQAIYLTLAILMGGGLVLFGVGGSVSGGLVDAFTGNGGGGSGGNVLQDRANALEKRVKANPSDARLWGELARARFNTVNNAGKEAEAKKALDGASAAWKKHLALAGDHPDPALASIMVRAYELLGDAADAVTAQEIVIEDRPDQYALYARLAQFAYAAGQQRKADLARSKALSLAPKDQRETVKSQLDQAQTQALQDQLKNQTQTTPAVTTTTP